MGYCFGNRTFKERKKTSTVNKGSFITTIGEFPCFCVHLPITMANSWLTLLLLLLHTMEMGIKCIPTTKWKILSNEAVQCRVVSVWDLGGCLSINCLMRITAASSSSHYHSTTNETTQTKLKSEDFISPRSIYLINHIPPEQSNLIYEHADTRRLHILHIMRPPFWSLIWSSLKTTLGWTSIESGRWRKWRA